MNSNYDIGYDRGILGLKPSMACHASKELERGYIDGAFDLGVERAQNKQVLSDFEERNEHVVRGFLSV